MAGATGPGVYKPQRPGTSPPISRLSGAGRACRPAEPMSDSAFESLADSLLAALEEGIGPHADAELQGGVLTVEGNDATSFDPAEPRNPPIWLRRPPSGAR